MSSLPRVYKKIIRISADWIRERFLKQNESSIVKKSKEKPYVLLFLQKRSSLLTRINFLVDKKHSKN